MKYITFAIPSYNSESYLHNAIDSVLVLGEEAEIVIINDGSKDRTIEIAKMYKKQYPNIIKVIDKENGGHGSGVNYGLKEATGLYYKVLDSDDWIDETNIVKLLNIVKSHHQNNESPDLYISDFIYEHVETNTHFIRNFKDNYPTDKIFKWNQAKKRFKVEKTLMMHSLMFKTSILKESKLELPEHTFYVDNIFSYTPLPFVETIYYFPEIIYHYFIGREDQSIQIHNIVKRYYQQINVMDILLREYSYDQIKQMPKKLSKYMLHLLSAIMMITQMFTTAEYSQERKESLTKLWKDLKTNDRKLYRYLRFRSYNALVNFLPWRIKGFVMVKGYKHFAKKVKWG